MNKKQLAVVAFLAGAGAAAMNGAATAHADTPPPPSTEFAAVTPADSVRDRVLQVARQEFDKQSPGTFYSEGVRQAWCANFVSWVMRQAGDPLTNVTNGSWRVPGVYTLKDTFAATNALEPRGYKPAPGDVVLYGGSGHTNIVVDVHGDDITTIGGNESNRVSQRTISRFSSNIMGFGRIAEDTPPPAAPLIPEPTALPAPPPPVDPFLPPPPPMVEVAPAVFEAPVAPPVDPFLPPPPPAPEFAPAVFDAPPPVDPPVGDTVLLSAPDEGLPHLSGALPGPVAP